jgi:two-component system phosphate regulon response regulator PhoB
MAQKHIVIVEDEPDILEILCYNLKREGFAVASAADGIKGLALIKQRLPDLVLLDLMLPGMGGLDICRALKGADATADIPVIMVSAKGEESDVVLGLGIGADDYVPKPFSPKELIARAQAVLRRSAGSGVKASSSGGADSDCIVCNGLLIDSGKHQVSFNGQAVKLTATQFRLLHHLARYPGRVFSREQLLNHAVSDGVVVVDRNIDVHIRGIRKKIGDQHVFIETVRGVGYRFRELD